MSHEAQLQNIISWAIPRFVEWYNEEHNQSITWAGYVPSNSAQSVANPASLGVDFLLFANCKVTFALELKYPKFSGENIEGMTFNPGQLDFLKAVAATMPVHICYPSDPEMTHRITAPAADEAVNLLQRVSVAPPNRLPPDFSEAENHLHGVLEQLLQSASDEEGANAEYPQLESLTAHVEQAFLGGVIPSNLFLLAASPGRLSAIPMHSVMKASLFLKSSAYEGIRKQVLELASAYIDREKLDKRKAAVLSARYHSCMEIVIGLMEDHRKGKNPKEWNERLRLFQDDLRKIVDQVTQLFSEALKAKKRPV